MICLDGELGMVARNSGMHHFTDESLLGAPLPAAVDVPEYLRGIERAAEPAGLPRV